MNEVTTTNKVSARTLRNDSELLRNAIIEYKKHANDETMNVLSSCIVTLSNDLQVSAPTTFDVFAMATTCKRKGNKEEGYTFFWDVKSSSQIRSFFLPHVDEITAKPGEVKESTPRTPRTPHVATPHEKAIDSAFGIAKRAAKKAFDETHALDDNTFTFPCKADWARDPSNVDVITAMEKLYAA